jgi:hypothetical protein
MRDFLRIQALVLCWLVSASAGAALSVATLGSWAMERYRADHPGEYACGLFAVPYLFLGGVVGAVGGAIAWWRIRCWLTRR